MNPRTALALVLALLLHTACAQSSTGTHTLPPSTGAVTLAISSAGAPEDWRSIAVKVTTVTLTPQGGGTPVTLFAAPIQNVVVDLAQTDQAAQILGTFAVPVGTYTAATLTLDADTSSFKTPVSLSPNSYHSPDFPGFNGLNAAGVTSLMNVPAGATALALPVTLAQPLVVGTDTPGILDLDFDLATPSFLVPSVPPDTTRDVRWAVDFDRVLRHRPILDVTRLALIQMQGYVESVATDSTAFAFKQVFHAFAGAGASTMPQALRVRADATRGTRYYDLVAGTEQLLKEFSALGPALVGTPVRIAARLQPDGTFVAARIWADTSGGWSTGREVDGHLQAVNAEAGTLTLEGAAPGSLTGMTITVNETSQFFLRDPGNPAADAVPIGTGTAFFRQAGLQRGMKVHTTSRFLNAPPYYILLSLDLEAPHVDGFLSAAGAQALCTRPVANGPAITVTLPFVAATTPDDAAGTQTGVAGFKWWSEQDPAQVATGAGAIPGFLASAGAGVDFGGTVGVLLPWSSSHVRWNDPAQPGGWSIQWTERQGLRLPPGTVASPWVASAQGGTFGMAVSGGTQTVTVEVSTVPGSATKFYEMALPVPNLVEWGPRDITGPYGNLALLLKPGSTVRVYGPAMANGHILARAIAHLTVGQ